MQGPLHFADAKITLRHDLRTAPVAKQGSFVIELMTMRLISLEMHRIVGNSDQLTASFALRVCMKLVYDRRCTSRQEQNYTLRDTLGLNSIITSDGRVNVV